MGRQYEQKEYVFLCSVCLENKTGNYFSGTCKNCLEKQTIKGERNCKLFNAVKEHCARFCLLIPPGTSYCYQDTCPLYPYKDKVDK